MSCWTPWSLTVLVALTACSAASTGADVPAATDAGSTPDGEAPSSEGGPGATGPDAGESGADDGAPASLHDGAAPSDAAPSAPARGASVPYVEIEAESGSTNGTTLGPSRAVNAADVFQSIAGESSGRQAVKLSGTGQYVRFTTTSAANSLVVRFVLPDSQDGAGLQATLGVYVDGTRVQSLPLSSRFAWAYGNPQTGDATTNDPGDGYAHHFYDEARVLLPADVPAGSTIALQQGAQDTAAYYVLDLVDLEEVPAALAQPAGTLSAAAYGATGNGTIDDGQALQSAIDAAQGQGMNVWLPPGTYLDTSTVLNVKNVAVYGAGMWRSTLQGASARFVCGGSGCQISDLALSGDTTLRDDSASVAGISGVFGTGSVLRNVWVEHFTTGAWIGINGNTPATGLLVQGARFRDTFADGINLCNGTSQSIVEQSTARNTGDDGFASWAYAGAGDPPDTGNVFRFDTAQVPWRANCFALYGGTGNAVQDSVCADVVTYPGILVDQEFDSHPFGGTTTIARDTVLRSGGSMFGTSWGAVTVSGHDPASPITGVQITDVDIQDATYSGLFFTGPADAIDAVALTNVTITGAGTYGLAVDSTASGSATASGVVVADAGTAGLQNGAPSAWTFTRQSGNAGW